MATESQHPSPLPPALSPQSAVKSCLDLPAFPVSFCTERDMSRGQRAVWVGTVPQNAALKIVVLINRFEFAGVLHRVPRSPLYK